MSEEYCQCRGDEPVLLLYGSRANCSLCQRVINPDSYKFPNREINEERIKLIGGSNNGAWEKAHERVEVFRVMDKNYPMRSPKCYAEAMPINQHFELYFRKPITIGEKVYTNLFFAADVIVDKWLQETFENALGL